MLVASCYLRVEKGQKVVHVLSKTVLYGTVL